MRIGMVSTFPPIECGIATYTSYLVEELKKLHNEVYIISEMGAAGERVCPAYNASDGNLAEKIFETMIKFTPDVVHIQHEYGLYGKDMGVNIIPLLYKFKFAGIPVVVTLHSVYEDFTEQQALITDVLLRISSAVIVHHNFQQESLKATIGEGGGIHVIPHGVREVTPVSDAKKKLKVEGKKTILLSGYFRPTKGYDRIVKMFPDIVKQVPDAWLLIAGKTRSQQFTDYRDYFFRLIEESPVRDRISVVRGQFPQKTFDTIISAADVVPMPYRIGSQSGIMAHCLAFGRPMVTSPLKSFVDTIEESKAGLIAEMDGFVEAIVRILNDEKLARELSENALRFVKSRLSWKKIAEETVKVYHKIVTTPYGRAKYVEF
ncbi:MAG: glycosyltransferase [Deltaproteobacteria bacterium]|nr:glycosyltransferase [Deltaproteobacteria bacterium]